MVFSSNAVLLFFKTNKEVELKVDGISMLPTIQPGQGVLVKRTDEYNVNDIIVFVYRNKFLIHRIIYIVSDIYVCRGDNAERLERITKKDICGKVINIIS